ncbi:uncharacterized protein LOC8277306 [Ricinus communis]|uniref:Uncharacterized protein n=1 Tax=Ricinus communis TaxID=3988 RepID=B9SIU6_RICCO|nr:uncharacterized protein LOC8277306 [Ricinus communis]EEF36435.1 conserved hypothetical protein [Ricinus communis]|eukprot:XP_002525915.1 uncharacterized protein LOC8277306 [Ricinus communis]
MNNITASEIAGLGVGSLLLCCAIAAPKIDSFISSSQRSSLGMCKTCGDLRMVACSKCRGIGVVKADGPFSFNMMDDLYQSLGGEPKVKTFKCSKCQARGRFSCPDCSAV